MPIVVVSGALLAGRERGRHGFVNLTATEWDLVVTLQMAALARELEHDVTGLIEALRRAVADKNPVARHEAVLAMQQLVQQRGLHL